ncbi:related to IQ calmodulin-binding motif domain protein [Rhynchosporium agropyri]|uniref:Related to IQ calmodulin-binding motif domain protein n=1 Tax=Rhynchosporium agropyri TaxID=914238 RepID=A0A1E1KPA1_9HELO|nr:related to IQ calmodulin-binding motif domain protein [Rhynchosporium agropyri]
MHRASETLSDPDHNMTDSTGPSDIPEDIPEDLDLINEESNDHRIHTPPPRIAARFYRPTTNRRKSSAASSRRNSISSAHSHQSQISSRHGESQSNHVAQHLRRASIIEDRKARLADRAAHAEKVRLRAAVAKAAPRSTTNSEERALAAQQAREKNLAEIVASCAEEVKRAKGIAESMKEKREAEGKKLRREMEERLAEAERRRDEILSRNSSSKRGRSLSQLRKSSSPLPFVRESISEEIAAMRIQQKWRIYRRARALKDFASLGLTIDSVRETSFEDVVDLLAQEKVLVATAQILRICGLKEGETGSVTEMTAVRTFLSAFLILGHPAQVLSGKIDIQEQEQVGVLPMRRDDLANPQLQDLVAKARDLLISFENVLSRLNSANGYTPPIAQLTSLSEVYATFFNAFIAWKARDSTTLIDMMVLQFVELDSIWQSVKDSTEEAVTDSYRDGIRENQLKLMVRIKRLAGAQQGKRLITNAMREARKTRTVKKPVGDSRPRAAESLEVEQPMLVDLAASEKAVDSQLQTLTPPATPQRKQKSQADELRIVRSILPSNRVVTHEIAMNREYRMDEDALKERNTIMQAVFERMRQAIVSGNSDIWVLAMAENIRGRLQQLLKEGNSIYQMIAEALDHEKVARELQAGSFSYEKFFSFMASLLPKLCAPVRDADIKDIVDNQMQNGDVVERLQALMRGINLMQLDYANYMLQQAAPHLIKNSIEYETLMFGSMVEEKSSNLPRTEHAWREARSKVVAEHSRRDPEMVNLARARPTPERMYAQMIVDVFTSLDSSVSSIPETLALDSKRIARIRADILRIVTCGAIILQCKNLLKRDVRSQWKAEATRIFSVLENAKTPEQASQGIQAALESSRSMPVATKNHIKDLVLRIVTTSAAASSVGGPRELSDPVTRLLMTRLRGHLLNCLSAATEKEKVKIASTASEKLASLGLPEFVHRIGAIVDEMAKVGALDKESHGIWYEEIAKRVEAEVSGAAA